MKFQMIFIAAVFLFSSSMGFAEVRYVDDIMAMATPQETENLARLLMQIKTVSVKNSKTGKSYQKVVGVEKGSVYERAGVKVGDILVNGKSKKNDH